MKTNKFDPKRVVSLAFLLLTFLMSCDDDSSTNPSVTATDYSKPEHWLKLPTSTPLEVDIFYLYPTSWARKDSTEPIVCELDNASLIKGSLSSYNRSATAFETVGNIYAPFYRQADANYTLALPLAEQEKIIGGIPKADVFAAFDYYIKHYNNGRPFILAGHSQGSNILIYLLSEYMAKNPDVYKRMVAAYVIGFSVTTDYLAKNPHLKFAEGPDDTGVIISYNTESPDFAVKNPVINTGALVINPINWKRDETLATKEQGLGSYLPVPPSCNFEKVPQYADAKIDLKRFALICSTANEEAIGVIDSLVGFPKGMYHSFDYPFYYFNIRSNAENRTKIFLKK